MTTKIKASNIALGAITQDRLSSAVAQGLFNYDTTITPEVLEIQANVDMTGQDATWLWTWTTSSLPYSRVDITTIPQSTVPLYAQGTYTINNFAAHELIGGMTQTHALYLKWIEGAGTANNINWVTYAPNVSKTHSSINGGSATQVTQLLFQVPSTITAPTLVAPNISYNVTNNTTSAFTFSGNAHGDNPTIGPFYRGGTYTFNVNASGHPFYLTEDNGSGFLSGQYVDEYTSGVTGSRTAVGAITFTVPNDAPDYLYYQCGNHASMRGTIRIKDLALTQNDNGNYVVYLQHSQDNHVTPVELRPLPSLVNQMCLVYDASKQKWVPQDLATYIDRTPSIRNKIKEVTGAISAAGGAATNTSSGVKIHPYANYLPLVGNSDGDIAYALDTEGLYVWSSSLWVQASGQVTPTKVSDQPNSSTGYFDVPSGTTSQRPVSPNVGYIRYNTTLDFLEQYTTDGWQGIAPPPTITSVSPTSYNGEQGTTITINGSAFETTAVVKFITAQGVEYTASSVTRVSASQLTATTPQDFTVANEPLKVKVLNGSGLVYTLDNAIDCGLLPSWSTASGTIATQFTTKALSTSIAAAETDGGSIVSYSIVSGSLPSGLSLNSSTGAITGTISASAGTYTFTARVTDNAGNTADRSFSINVTALPSGGSITTSGNYRIHTFTGSSTFTNTIPNLVCQYLIVGGGGSGGIGDGGNDCGGGGGGAGGYICSVPGESSGGGCGTAPTYTASATSYSVIIGAGGGARVGGSQNGYNGGDSSVFGITAYGGGGGSNRGGPAGSGGSGGGGSCTGNYGSGTSCQGYRGGGGTGTPAGGTYGGGGAGGYAAYVPSGGVGTPGGSGVNSSITGSSVGYAGGGGGGGGQSSGGSASHGGGAGGNSPRGTGGSGTANTGGAGGGAGGYADGNTTSGAGGSGVVVIRYDVTTF